MSELKLSCRCGKVRGVAEAYPNVGNRLICYCNSCQNFPRKLGAEDAVLDEYGGTDIYQMPPAHLRFTEGTANIRCLKHTDKGLLRWYAGCCDTPLANAPAGMPFVGLLHACDTEPARRDEKLGPVRSYAFPEEAKGSLPPEHKGGLVRLVVRFLGQMVWWRIKGKVTPHPFFDASGEPIATPEVRP